MTDDTPDLDVPPPPVEDPEPADELPEAPPPDEEEPPPFPVSSSGESGTRYPYAPQPGYHPEPGTPSA